MDRLGDYIKKLNDNKEELKGKERRIIEKVIEDLDDIQRLIYSDAEWKSKMEFLSK